MLELLLFTIILLFGILCFVFNLFACSQHVGIHGKLRFAQLDDTSAKTVGMGWDLIWLGCHLKATTSP